jgi:transposase-like protein
MEIASSPEPVTTASDPRSIGLFEDRYGVGAQARLLALLQQPCVTFAEIADQFGVTRECVRRWHQRLLPGAPTGHERQRLCRQYQRKRALFRDELFAGFYRRFRAQVPSRRIGLIPARDGFRRRAVRLDRHVIALKKARASAAPASAASYRLVNGVGEADFVYYELNETDYLFVPRPALSEAATTFVDATGSTYHQFKNTFGALWRWPTE